ncbi:hypothetical protein LZ30DRAFT_780214 [Colletotrichum cereale]|nr:hypothetical protein LZ30DRAFT_780214 [Colletotrichum cereale]
MVAQETEDMAHPEPPLSEHHSETEHHNQKSDQQDKKKSERKQPKPKTETEERIEKKTPPLNLDASTPEADSAQRNSKRVARRSKRTAVARTTDESSAGGSHQPPHGQQVAPQNRQVQNRSRGGAPSIRLDLNLDVEIHLKAKIKGDIELSILGGKRGGR